MSTVTLTWPSRVRPGSSAPWALAEADTASAASSQRTTAPTRRSRRSPSSSFVAAVEEVLHALDDVLLGVDRVQDARPGQRVTGEEALVEHLPAPERAAGDVPGQAKELHAVARGGAVGRQVMLDVRR